MDWDCAMLTLHSFGNPLELFPFRVERKLDSKDWVEYPTGCTIHAKTGAHTYTSVRVQLCPYYIGRQIQFSTEVNGAKAQTTVPIVVYRKKRKSYSNSAYGHCGNVLVACGCV